MIITDQQELTKLCENLKNHPFITIDTEFLREKTYYPKLCLVQVSGPDQKAAAIDPVEGDLDLSPLFEILRDRKILKVIHSGRQDLEIFYNLMGEVPGPFFDTQIAAMVCGYGDSVGYEGLVRDLTGNALDKGMQFTDWSRRPLSDRQIDYALGDVTHLVEIYKKLSARLDDRGRTQWVFEEEKILSNPATYNNAPEDSWRRIKMKTPRPRDLAVLREIAAWREHEAQRKNLPRAWIMRDETLADMASQAPTTPDQFKKIRGITPDFADGEKGEALIGLIKKALESDKSTWPKPEARKIIPPDARATAEILKMLLRIQSAEYGVAAKLIAGTDDLDIIAMENAPDIPAMKGWRHDVFGKDAMALKAGKIAIGMKDGHIFKYAVEG
jgi:ribonuclease D